LVFFSTLLGGPIVTQKTLPVQSYGQVSQGYGGTPLIPQLDQQQPQQQLPVQSYGQVSQGYGGMPLIPQLDQQQQPVPQVPVLTPAGKILNFF